MSSGESHHSDGTTLIAVTAKSNRSEADTAPAQWLPPAGRYPCEYAAQRTATKLRWNLVADDAERQALLGVAEDCPSITVVRENAL